MADTVGLALEAVILRLSLRDVANDELFADKVRCLLSWLPRGVRCAPADLPPCFCCVPGGACDCIQPTACGSECDADDHARQRCSWRSSRPPRPASSSGPAASCGRRRRSCAPACSRNWKRAAAAATAPRNARCSSTTSAATATRATGCCAGAVPRMRCSRRSRCTWLALQAAPENEVVFCAAFLQLSHYGGVCLDRVHAEAVWFICAMLEYLVLTCQRAGSTLDCLLADVVVSQRPTTLIARVQVELPTDQDAQRQSFSRDADASSAMLKRLRPWQILVLRASTGHEGLALVRQVQL